jgi:hypothetical protein
MDSVKTCKVGSTYIVVQRFNQILIEKLKSHLPLLVTNFFISARVSINIRE